MIDTAGLDFESYVRTPFRIKAVRITAENIEEVARRVGSLEMEEDRQVIILDKKIVQTIGKAYIDWWLTIMDNNYRCYSPGVFKRQFVSMPNGSITAWEFARGSDQKVSLVPLADIRFGDMNVSESNLSSKVDDLSNKVKDLAGRMDRLVTMYPPPKANVIPPQIETFDFEESDLETMTDAELATEALS